MAGSDGGSSFDSAPEEEDNKQQLPSSPAAEDEAAAAAAPATAAAAPATSAAADADAAAFLPVPAAAQRLLSAVGFGMWGFEAAESAAAAAAAAAAAGDDAYEDSTLHSDSMQQQQQQQQQRGAAEPGSRTINEVKTSSSLLPVDYFRRFPVGCLQGIFCFLEAEEILKVSGVCAAWRAAVHNSLGAFQKVSAVRLEGVWLRLGERERQQALLQLQQLHQLEVPAAAFAPTNHNTSTSSSSSSSSKSSKSSSSNSSRGVLLMEEVAAVVASNSSSLRVLELQSAESPSLNCSSSSSSSFNALCSSLGRPFALRPLTFSSLYRLSISGVDTPRWLHALNNCKFPKLKTLRVTYFPPSPTHWSWKVNPKP